MLSMIRHKRTSLRTFAMLLLLLAALPLAAQQDVRHQQLKDLRQRIEQERRKQERLRQEQEALEREMARIKRELAEKASHVQALEQEINTLDTRLQRLQAQHGALLTLLAENRAGTVQLLAALQRLRSDPPPPFVTRPDDVLKALRSALAMRAILPRLRQRAQTLRNRLERLVRVRAELKKARARKKARQEQLRTALARVNGLLRLKADLLDRTKTRVKTQAQRLAALLAQARNVQELLRSLDRERQRRQRPPSAGMPGSRKAAVPFPRLKGRLPWPAQGSTVVAFGRKTALAGISRGLYLATRPGAVVTAPADARVEVAGPFRSYGKLVILDMGDGYRILLAGLEKTMVRTGETVQAGEPLGHMGGRAQPATLVDERIDATRPILYMELRNREKVIDPARWLAGAGAGARKG